MKTAPIVRWAHDCIHVVNPETGALEPLRLYPHQIEFLTEATRRGPDGRLVHRACVASWPKREGKSAVAALLILERLVHADGQVSVILANSKQQAQSVIFDTVKRMLRSSPQLACLVNDNDIQRTRIEVPATGGVLECLPNNADTVQGIAVTGICATDELHAAQDTAAFEWLTNQTESAESQIVISSQAGAPHDSNPVWRYYQQRDTPDILFHYLDEHRCPWALALAERQRKTLHPSVWDYMHRNQWGATGIRLFNPDDIANAAKAYEQPETAAEWHAMREAGPFAKRPCTIAAGLDRAGVSTSGDRTVWVVVARFEQPDGEPVFRVVRCAVLATGAEAEVMAEYARTQAIFGTPARVMLESYGCQDIVGRIPGASLESPSAQRQQALFTRLHRVFAEGRIGFPQDAGRYIDTRGRAQTGLLKAELLAAEFDCERGETLVRYCTQRGHDDAVYALAWAVEAAGSVRTLAPIMTRQSGRRRVVVDGVGASIFDVAAHNRRSI